ncbi:9371_t:CDS:2 [Diversispora eburnea]|uniref:9371_t:CDS:1 n=1 Tax=Diversispora eburnea TaxID=1213867 RepID=A0A9N8UYK0_9GLOM|nr:9371_t:CDS:2 [Diversispora eburnea]
MASYPSSNHSSVLSSRISGESVFSNSSSSTTYTQFTLPIAAQYSSPTKSTFNDVNVDYRIEHVDSQANWYRKYFYGKDTITIKTNRESIYWYRYIVRKRDMQDERSVLVGPPVIPLGEPLWDDLLKMINKDFANGRLTKFITTPELSKELLNLDESRNTEEEWFSNTYTSSEYDKFLNILGNEVQLQGWQGFGGGLDTKTGETGDCSIHDIGTWKDFEIMYHVCTMLPYERKDKYQITRKRHIGNDVRKPFSPSSIRSQFLHVFLVVSPVLTEDGSQAYSVEIVCKEGVPNFGPAPPNPPIFYDMTLLKRFIVATVINGQNAALKTPKLCDPFLRARYGRMDDLAHQFVPIIIPPLSSPIPEISKKDKISHKEELNSMLKSLFVNELKCGSGRTPEIMRVKTLLDRGADPNIRIPQPIPNSRFSFSSEKDTNMDKINYSNLHKLPNILFAVILLSDDPIFAKLLVNYGCETMPQDQYFPNAFVFAAKCLLENVPSLGDPERVDAAIDNISIKNSSPREKSYNKLWRGLSGIRKWKENITRGY